MKVVRVYGDENGESHFEDLEVPLNPARYGSLSELVPTTGVMFRETPPGGELDFHNAPRRQFVITMTGEVEVEATDGEKRRLGAGGILLADDTRGRGHITREVSGPRTSLFLPLPDDFDISGWRTTP